VSAAIRLPAAALALAAGALLTPLAAAPAQAADGGMEFSIDGSAWSPAPPAALFADGALRLVPGGSTAATVRVRNVQGEPGVLTAVLVDVQADGPDTAFGFGVAGGDGGGGGLARTPVAELGECVHVIAPRVLAAGEAVPITVTVDLGAYLTGAQAQGGSISFGLALGLHDPGVELPAFGCSGPPVVIPSEPRDPGSQVALTGSELGARAVLVALGMGGAGCLLVLVARRRRRAQPR